LNYGLPFEEWVLDFARKLGIKIVYTVHNVLPQDTGERYRRVYERIYRGADRLICHDQGAARRLMDEFTIEPGRISVIPHGPLFQPQGPISAGPARRRLGFHDSECVVLWQGILRPYKGISFLLDAWRRVADLNTGARLAIVGTGEKDQIQGVLRGISERKLQKSVRPELRFVPVEELSDYYSAADILVYPYREITTSGALMTGINYGKAIVTTVLPAFQKLLRDGENALLIPYGDAKSLADCLVSLIRYPDLRSHLARAASRIPAAMNGWTDIARQTLDCYRAALSS
jgi:glycosyltransferase involved in cell wall biosynthesis